MKITIAGAMCLIKPIKFSKEEFTIDHLLKRNKGQKRSIYNFS
jgi:hypothetical protein